jgi:hypothetical protein
VTVEIRAEASYPEDFFSYEEIRGGAVVLYLFGNSHSINESIAIMYCFYGISLAT